MLHALLALPLLAPSQLAPGLKTPEFVALNVVEDHGFEKALAPAWSDKGSYVDPKWLGDKKQYLPLKLDNSGHERSGKRALLLRTTGQYVSDADHLHAEVAQTLDKPLAVGPLTGGSLYIFNYSDTKATVAVQLDYTDGSKGTVEGQVSRSSYDQSPAKGWQKIDFKPALFAGKTVSRVTIMTDGYPHNHADVSVDDVYLGTPVKIH